MIAVDGPRRPGKLRRLDTRARLALARFDDGRKRLLQSEGEADGTADVVDRLRRALTAAMLTRGERSGSELRADRAGDDAAARASVAAIAARLAKLVRPGAAGETEACAEVIDFCVFRRQRLASRQAAGP